jgi:hypothetical protein
MAGYLFERCKTPKGHLPHLAYLITQVPMYVCMYVYFSSGGREARKVPYWGTGRAELESLVLKST